LVHTWFNKVGRGAWATCPIRQLGFIGISSNAKIIRDAVSPRAALAVLEQIIALPGHHFWPDAIAPAQAVILSSLSLVGHRQVTDAYLLSLAQHRKGKLATLNGGASELILLHKQRARYVAVIA